jgi:hypothetical protein
MRPEGRPLGLEAAFLQCNNLRWPIGSDARWNVEGAGPVPWLAFRLCFFASSKQPKQSCL